MALPFAVVGWSPVKKDNFAKDHYKQLRVLSCQQLWTEEVPAFDRAPAAERVQNVAVVRAVGVVFSESGTAAQRAEARDWLRTLLRDPEEKIRRYAMTALPKVGGEAEEESALLGLLETNPSEREKKYLGRTLEKIGGEATLAATADGKLGLPALRKAEANVARLAQPSEVLYERPLTDFSGLQIYLHCRAGLEDILEDEITEHIQAGAPFRHLRRAKGLLVVEATKPFTLDQIFDLRCFSTVGFVPAGGDRMRDEVETVAALIASPGSRALLESFTDGPIRYRLDFVSKGHQRYAVRRVADRVYDLCPSLLNDARNAPWQINIHHGREGCTVEITPKIRPDPRYAYRQGDVPAASHPPLAACMARLAGPQENDIVWDPFCGSGLELIERGLRGGVKKLIGTDLSPEALATARENIAAAWDTPIPHVLSCHDFRGHAKVDGLGEGSVSLVISNPPMGQRVPIPNLNELIEDLFTVSAKVLRPGGRLVFANPRAIQPDGLPLRLDYRRKVDLGGFTCHLEKYTRL